MNLIHKVRKGLSTLLATSVVAMTLVVSPSAQAASFADVPADAWFAPYVNALTDAGVFTSNTNFRPADNMNRAEFVKTLVVAAGVSMEGAAEAGFSDVSSTDWFAPYVNAAVAAGIVNGSDVSSTFRPVDNVTRAEAVKIALNAFGIDYASYVEPKAAFADDNGHWAEDMVSAAYNLSIVDGQAGSKTAFAPNEAISRSAVAKVATFAVIVAEDAASYVRFDDGSSAFSVFEADEITSQVAALIEAPVTGSTDEEPTTTDEEEEMPTETPVASDGTLEVSLAADSPASATLPGAVAGVTVAKFDVTANGDDVMLQSLVLRRGGLGSDGVVSSVAVLDETGRVSKSKTINNTTDDATITFLGGGISIPAGETKTLSVVAALGYAQDDGSATADSTDCNNDAGTFSSCSGSEFTIELVSAAAVTSNAQEVVGDFPVKGNLMKLGSTNAASLQFQADGEPSDPKLGEKGVEITKFKLKNQSSQDSISFKSITLKEEGTIDESEELANYVLYIEGEKVAEAVTAQNKYVTFNLATPYTIKSSKTVKAVVKADILGGADKTIMFALDNTLDLVADDLKTGFGAGVEYATAESAYEGFSLEVQAGEITLTTVDAVNTDVLKDKDDIIGGTIKVATKSGKDLELQKVKVTLSATSIANLAADSDTIAELVENVELYDVKTGTVYDLSAGTQDDTDMATSGGTSTVVFSDTSLTIPVTGDKEFQIRFDTKNPTVNDVANVNFTFSLTPISGTSSTSAFFLVETADDTAVSDITPSSITFKKLTGASSTTTISTITQSATKNAVIGTKEVEAYEFEVKAGSASALDLDEVKVTGTIADNASSSTITVVSAAGLAEGVNPASGNVVITKGDTTTDTIAVDLAATDDTIAEVATAIAAAIDADSDYAATATLGVVTVTGPVESIATTSLKSAIDAATTTDDVTLTAAYSNNGAETVMSNTRVNKVTLYKVEGATKTALDTVSGSQISSTGVVVFDGFKVNIAANATARFLVTLDIVDDSTKGNDTIKLALTSVSLSDKDSDDVTSGTVNSSANTTLNTAIGVNSTRTIIVKGVGSLTIAADTTDSATDKTKYVLGGSTSDFVASYELTATNEGVIIRDLTLTQVTGGVDLQAAVAEVILYKNDKTTEIARKSVTSDTVEFTDINYTVAEGSENIYVKVVANKMGKDQAGSIVADMTLTMSATDADGASSNKQVSGLPETSGASLAFSTLPTRISNVEFVESFGGVSRATKLNSGVNNVAIIKVTTDSSTNTDVDTGASLKTQLTAMKLDVTNYIKTATSAGTAITAMTIEKINGNNAAIAVASGGTALAGFDAADAVFALTGTDYDIDNGTSAYYVVKANVTKDTTIDNDDYVKVQFSALNNSNVVYQSNDTSNTVSVTDLRIGQTKIDGTQINE